MLAGEETETCGSHQIIHAGIELIALQPAARIMPNLANDISFWINGTHTSTKFLPERIIVNLAGHIETPAINAELDPIFRNIENKFAAQLEFEY